MHSDRFVYNLRRKLRERAVSHFFVDADDTLWHDAKYFRFLKGELLKCCSRSGISEEHVLRTLCEELKKVKMGERGFAAAIESTADRLDIDCPAKEALSARIDDFLRHDIELLPYCEPALQALSTYQLVLLTKGDTCEQRAKVARSGLNDYFSEIIVVRRKEPDTFLRLLAERHLVGADVVSVGNSIRHDVVPAVKVGAIAIWMDHPDNQYGRNDVLPAEAYRADSWLGILDLVHCP